MIGLGELPPQSRLCAWTVWRAGVEGVGGSDIGDGIRGACSVRLVLLLGLCGDRKGGPLSLAKGENGELEAEASRSDLRRSNLLKKSWRRYGRIRRGSSAR